MEVVCGSGLLVGGRSERGCGLVAVGSGRGGSVVPLRGTGAVLAAFRQICPLWKGRAPLLVRAVAETVTAE